MQQDNSYLKLDCIICILVFDSWKKYFLDIQLITAQLENKWNSHFMNYTLCSRDEPKWESLFPA